VSILLALAASGGGVPPVSVTYTSSQTITIPAGVSNLVSVSGKGGSGSPASSGSYLEYAKVDKEYTQYNDQGGNITTYTYGTTYHFGEPTPADYCDPLQSFPGAGGVTNYKQVCHYFTDMSSSYYNPPTTGGSTTGFNLTFPGGYGGAAQAQTYSNVGVTPGGQYNIVVPPGGSITISYYP
jgi:hypothetical protein